MILTFKIRHGQNYKCELEKARQVANYALKSKVLSSKSVKHIGLPSAISNQILRKYSRNKNLKRVNSVKLTVPAQGIKFDGSTLRITCLKLSLPFSKICQKINQIELNHEYAFVSCTVSENTQYQPNRWIGVDRNTTGHCVVAANGTTGKMLKLGKKAQHIHRKYKQYRKRFQKSKKFRAVKQFKNRESRIVRDLNHKISRKLVEEAKKNNAGLVFEDLKGIRNTKKQARSFKYFLHSWSFYQLLKFVEYKAKLLGVPVVKIDPRYSSQQCSKCGLLGNRKGKLFKCPHCGHSDHADVNAAFVLAKRHEGVIRLPVERDTGKGSTDTPLEATG